MTIQPRPRLAALARGFTVLAMLILLPAAPAWAAFGDQLFKLIASDPANNDWFGRQVALSGSKALIGARWNSGAASNGGAAYLFDVTTGQQLFKLTAADAAADDHFGVSVAISANRALVGAWEDDDVGNGSGSAYLFDVTTGQQLRKFTASDGAAGDSFGTSVALSGNRAIIGAPWNDAGGADSGAAYLFDVTTGQELFKLNASDAAANALFGRSTAIDNNRAIVGAAERNSAYIFDVTTGQQLHKLTASDAASGDSFGWAVALHGNTAIVGARYDNPVGNGSSTTGRGSAYVFDVTTGQQRFKLTASDAAAGDAFGWDVELYGKFALIGAPWDDDGASGAGSAYLFDVTTGQQIIKFVNPDPGFEDLFGISVALSGNAAIVGAYLDDHVRTNAGSAYVFEIASKVPGDFDGDGDVDGADFVAWQTNFPKASGATLAMGDADGDGDVDGADFVVWQTNFPFTPGGAASPVPEPGAIALALIGIGGLLVYSSRSAVRKQRDRRRPRN